MPWVISKRGTRYWRSAPVYNQRKYAYKKKAVGPGRKAKYFGKTKQGYAKRSRDVVMSGYGSYRATGGGGFRGLNSRTPTIRNASGNGVIIRHKV